MNLTANILLSEKADLLVIDDAVVVVAVVVVVGSMSIVP